MTEPINQVLILLGEYVVKWHLAVDNCARLEEELAEAKQEILHLSSVNDLPSISEEQKVERSGTT